ncbi:hypothetical protein UA32_16185 [Photobacterium angustum]|uniref:TonB-dependent siderophore receptor n=1 Tax=Photobacterium angustum TaxID=661 RepID=A0ABX5H8F1_PHOAN|nr:TonB-dependent receptor [Photobacterium angustum]KJG36545.1 hypothetical protein UA32_16185 [Photobacterium angustum]PSX12355.1 TonB-dependent siderophore receptor [Photobacterium angustum]
MNTFKITNLTSAILATLLPCSGYAQEVTTFEVITVEGHSPEDYQPTSTSTATGIELSPVDTPRNVTAIDSKSLEDLQATSLHNALKIDTSVQERHNSDGMESFAIRGFRLDSGYGYFRDGEQKDSMLQEPSELYEQIEVLKGPAGLFFGKGSPGGIINMITKKPQGKSSTSFSQDIGSNNNYRSVFDTTGSATDKLRYRFIGSKQTKDNWRKYKDGNHPSTDRDLLALMLDYDLSENTMLSLNFDTKNQNGHSDHGLIFDKEGNQFNDQDLILDAPWAKNTKTEDVYGMKLTHYLNDAWQVSASYHHTDIHIAGYNSQISLDDDSIETGNYKIKPTYSQRHYDIHTAAINLTGEFTTKGIEHQLITGVNLRDHTLTTLSSDNDDAIIYDASINHSFPIPDFNISDLGSFKPENRYPRQTYGIYMQDIMTFNSDWQIMTGLRYDQYHRDKTTNDKKEGTGKNIVINSIVPNFSLMFHPYDNSTIYLSYAEGFEPQDPITDPLDVNYGQIPEPKTSKLYEVGFKSKFFNDRALLTTSIFHIREDNGTVTEQISDNSEYDQITLLNASQIHTGADFSITGRISDKLKVITSAQYIIGKYENNPILNDKKPKELPRISASLLTSYNLTNSIELHNSVYYVGSRFGDNENKAKKAAYTKIDSGLSYHIPMNSNQDLSVIFNVNNILDKKYVDTGDYSGMTPGEGRNYMLSLKYDI